MHTEQTVLLCRSCWTDHALDHGLHDKGEHHVVVGKLCFPARMAPREFQRALDALIANKPSVELYAPELSAAAGDAERARSEERRMAMIKSSA